MMNESNFATKIRINENYAKQKSIFLFSLTCESIVNKERILQAKVLAGFYLLGIV